ncbi:protein spaetzle-like [Ochlerotatus camptorhynchus]|uniref:protein spaetzle-like n=1 Tax=Ochlerotatus camptorhynchus TaxID=644619 RepID=UPI0031D8B6A9
MFTLILVLLLVTPLHSAVGVWPLVRSREVKLSARMDGVTQESGKNTRINRSSTTKHPISHIEQPTESSTSATRIGLNFDFMFANDVKPRIDMSEDCSPDYPICTNVVDYPQQLVNEIIARQEYRFAEVFGDDVVMDSGDTLIKRFDTSDDEFICMSEEKLVHPQSGYTIKDQLVMIVNTPSYMQGVRIETCRNPGESCNKLQYLISMYTTECKQLYHYRTLLAFDAVTNQPYKESFRLPSCCKCVIRPIQRVHL